MYRLQVKTHFDAAHYLKDYDGKCNREHGHRWDVEVCIQGKELNSCNMVVDFKTVKGALNCYIEKYLDHFQLNETLKEDNPTAEFLAKWLFDMMDNWVRRIFVVDGVVYLRLARVCVWESPDCCVKYSSNMGSINDV